MRVAQYSDEIEMRIGRPAPLGCAPAVEATGRRFSLETISAVSARDEFRFMVHEGAFTALVLREFLARLMLGTRERVFLVVDSGPIHNAMLVQHFMRAQKGRPKLFQLPSY
ncbi:transposase [Trinickia caryophylli]|nr:transposase [Trinickia caryophylli]WQE14776.1 transposase [Trinickia caryophylli]GLU34976.1 hypothetical protein Busp01_48180 [Trinickia caryophylli]